MTTAAPYAGQLRALPFVREARILVKAAKGEDAAPDGVLRLRTPDGEHRFTIALRRSHLDRVTAEHLAHALSDDRASHIVMAPYVGEPIGDLFEARGINFVDLQGNCSLRIGDRYIARIQRRRAPPRESHDKPLRGAGYQVLMALLIEPKLLRATLQEVATAAGTSRQAPFDMLRRLEHEGFAGKTSKGLAWIEHRRGELLDRFFVGYRDVLRSKLLLGRWRTQASEPPALEARLEEVLGTPAVWRYGGAAGGHRLDGYYQSPTTTLHATKLPADFARRVRALPATDGNLVALGIPGPIARTGPRDDVVHPLLVCAELLTLDDDRAREAAQRIRARFLA